MAEKTSFRRNQPITGNRDEQWKKHQKIKKKHTKIADNNTIYKNETMRAEEHKEVRRPTLIDKSTERAWTGCLHECPLYHSGNSKTNKGGVHLDKEDTC